MILTFPQSLAAGSHRPLTIQKITRDQWSGLWRAFRGLRHIFGEREALVLIEKNCRQEALLILEVLL